MLLREDDSRDVDAFVEALLARHAGAPLHRLADPSPLPRLVDRRVEAAAMELGSSLVRFHPSFRFEDRLAACLRSVARGDAPAAAVVLRPARLIEFPLGPTASAQATEDDGEAEHARGLLLGGAIASGVSIAGAALFAWRRGRGTRSTPSFARAARAAHRLGSGASRHRGSALVAARLGSRLAARRARTGIA